MPTTEAQRLWHEKNKPRKLAYMKRYRKENLEKVKASSKACWAKHRKKYSATNKEWAARNKDKRDAARKRYLEKLVPEKVRELARVNRARRRKSDPVFREKELLNSREWRKRNRPTMVAHSRKRKAQKKRQTPSDADFKLIELFYEISQRVAECLGVKHHVDHMFPIAKGGLHHQRNLRVIPARINQQKNAKVIPFESAA